MKTNEVVQICLFVCLVCLVSLSATAILRVGTCKVLHGNYDAILQTISIKSLDFEKKKKRKDNLQNGLTQVNAHMYSQRK